MKTKYILTILTSIILIGCSITSESNSSNNNIDGDFESKNVVVAYEQLAGSKNKYASSNLTGGVKLNLDADDIVKIEMESVDGYAIAGEAEFSQDNGVVEIKKIIDKKSIITLTSSDGGTFAKNIDYYIATFPCDVYGGYRLSFYTTKDTVAPFFGVHQRIKSGEYITPIDLKVSELEFAGVDEPLEEDERPELDAVTQAVLSQYRKTKSEEDKNALLEQMGVKYDKVVARKKAKLRELEREAHDQSLIDEMQAIVDEMTENREIRLEQQFWRLVDPRTDDDTSDQWLVLRGSSGNNAYIAYAPVTNEEYKLFDSAFTYPSGQEKFPVVTISYTKALAYCAYLSSNDSTHTYRLPSEEEWILAAGHMPKDIVMNSGCVESGLTAVDAYAQSKGACGGIDFWGNCWEWTSTQNSSGKYIVKGGSWDSDRDSCRTEYSDDSRDGSQGYANVGFRVVREDL